MVELFEVDCAVGGVGVGVGELLGWLVATATTDVVVVAEVVVEGVSPTLLGIIDPDE